MAQPNLISILFSSYNFIQASDLINRLAAEVYSGREAAGKI